MTIRKLAERHWAFDIDRTWSGDPLSRAEATMLTVELSPRAELRVTVDAPYAGDPPPGAPPGRVDGLWNHEVVELFLARGDRRAVYFELELGPHGHHLALGFNGVRQPSQATDSSSETVDFSVSRNAGRWAGTARLELPASLTGTRLRGNAFRIWGRADRRFEVAARLPGSTPDFHQPQHFPSL